MMTKIWPPPDNPEALPQDGWAWSDFSHLVFDFAGVLRAADLLPFDELEYWERPGKWEREHQLWVDAGEPRNPDRGAPASLTWQRFLRAVNETGTQSDDHERAARNATP